MRIADYRAAVAEGIREKIPGLRDCRVYGGRFDLTEIKNVSVQAPGVFVATLRAGSNTAYGDGRRIAALEMAAYILTMDSREHGRDVAALNISEVLLSWLPYARFGFEDLADPSEVRWANLYSGLVRGQAIALMAVTWSQDLVIGQECDPDGRGGVDDPVPEHVWLGYAPRIGLGNEPYYDELTADHG